MASLSRAHLPRRAQAVRRNHIPFESMSHLLIDHMCVSAAGEEALSNLGINNSQNSIWAGFLFLLMQFLLFHTLGYLFLLFTAGRKKG